MTYKFGFAAVLLLSSTRAFSADNRIQTIVYDPDEVVKIVGRAGVQSTIEFASDERIENVAVGDSALWQITPNRRASVLFLKPLARATSTNMTVITDQRVYMFDLLARASAGAPVYSLRFHYPNSQLRMAQAAKPATPRLVEAAAATTFTPAQLNFGWKTKGDKRLLPARVFDDGTSLYLSWSGDTALPAILTLSADGKEGPINYRTAGDYIVIDAPPSSLVLRHGKIMARVWRTAPIMRRAPTPSVAPTVQPQTPSTITYAAAPQRGPMVANAAAPRQRPALTRAVAQLRRPDVRALLTDKLSGTSDAK